MLPAGSASSVAPAANSLRRAHARTSSRPPAERLARLERELAQAVAAAPRPGSRAAGAEPYVVPKPPPPPPPPPAAAAAACCCAISPPPPAAASPFEETWLTPLLMRDPSLSLGEGIAQSEVIVSVPNIATADELQALFAAGLAACEARDAAAVTSGRGQTAGFRSGESGRNRFMVSDTFGLDTVLSCEEVLLRVIDRVDEQMPSVYPHLFAPCDEWKERQPNTAQGGRPLASPPPELAETCPSLRELYMAGELEWSEGEPAINVYTAGGRFGAHKDHLALTVLVPLTAPDEFAGGGTGFWAADSGGPPLPGLEKSELADGGAPADAVVLKPPLGTALVFGGDLTHAGMDVRRGSLVLVASFSTALPPRTDRCHGLRAPGG